MYLETLDSAIKDNKRIYALAKNSKINNDGHSYGTMVPNPLGQKSVINNTLQTGQVKESSVVYIESHGTATLIGDPIEFEAISSIYGNYDKIYQHAQFKKTSPLIELEKSCFQIPTKTIEFKFNTDDYITINSLGMGGDQMDTYCFIK